MQEAVEPNVDFLGVDDETFGYEEIMSDEEDLPEDQYEEEWFMEEWEDWLKPFAPSHFQMESSANWSVQPWQTFRLSFSIGSQDLKSRARRWKMSRLR